MKFRSINSIFLALVSVAAVSAQTASLVGTYTFQNSLNANQGGVAPLVAANPVGTNSFLTDMVLGQSRTVYEMVSAQPNQNAGLSLNANNLVNPNTYSLEMIFAFTLPLRDFDGQLPGTFHRENVRKEMFDVERKQTRFRGCGRSPEG
ncbi:MAG: hypothetical protein FJW36_08605, partial [Acidobacteria bacterium]|nr:hypothetical protein [Acidobacteriota bacterium]